MSVYVCVFCTCNLSPPRLFQYFNKQQSYPLFMCVIKEICLFFGGKIMRQTNYSYCTLIFLFSFFLSFVFAVIFPNKCKPSIVFHVLKRPQWSGWLWLLYYAPHQMHSPSDLFSLGLSGQHCPHARCCDRLYAPVLDGFPELPQPLIGGEEKKQNCGFTLTAKSAVIFNFHVWAACNSSKRCLLTTFNWFAPSFYFGTWSTGCK